MLEKVSGYFVRFILGLVAIILFSVAYDVVYYNFVNARHFADSGQSIGSQVGTDLRQALGIWILLLPALLAFFQFPIRRSSKQYQRSHEVKLSSPVAVNMAPSPKPQSRTSKVFWAVLSSVSLVILVSFQRVRQQERWQERQVERAQRTTTIWIPNPFTGQNFPYYDVEIVKVSPGYVKFRTLSGEVMEHSGQYTISTQ